MKTIKRAIKRGKWFDKSPIYKRSDPRYVRKVFVRYCGKVLKHFAPEISDATISGFGCIGMMVACGVFALVLSMAVK